MIPTIVIFLLSSAVAATPSADDHKATPVCEAHPMPTVKPDAQTVIRHSSAEDGTVTIVKRGPQGEIMLEQSGPCNDAAIAQNGSNNRATIRQSGTGNSVVVQQGPAPSTGENR